MNNGPKRPNGNPRRRAQSESATTAAQEAPTSPTSTSNEREPILNTWDKQVLERGVEGLVKNLQRDFGDTLPSAIVLPDTSARPLYHLLNPVLKSLNKDGSVSRFYFFKTHKWAASKDWEEAGEGVPDESVEKAREMMRRRAQEILAFESQPQYSGGTPRIAIIDDYKSNGYTEQVLHEAFQPNKVPLYSIYASETDSHAGHKVSTSGLYPYGMNPNPDLPHPIFTFSYNADTHRDAKGVKKDGDTEHLYATTIRPNTPEERHKLADQKQQLRDEMRTLGEQIAAKIASRTEGREEVVHAAIKETVEKRTSEQEATIPTEKTEHKSWFRRAADRYQKIPRVVRFGIGLALAGGAIAGGAAGLSTLAMLCMGGRRALSAFGTAIALESATQKWKHKWLRRGAIVLGSAFAGGAFSHLVDFFDRPLYTPQPPTPTGAALNAYIHKTPHGVGALSHSGAGSSGHSLAHTMTQVVQNHTPTEPTILPNLDVIAAAKETLNLDAGVWGKVAHQNVLKVIDADVGTAPFGMKPTQIAGLQIRLTRILKTVAVEPGSVSVETLLRLEKARENLIA